MNEQNEREETELLASKDSANDTATELLVKYDFAKEADAQVGVESSTSAVKTKKSKMTFIIVGTILLIGIVVFIAFMVANAKPERRAAKELELARQYLDEMNYEMAIASYTKVVEIDPRNVEAYEGLANTYVAMAEEAIIAGDIDVAIEYFENAIEALEQGIAETGEQRLVDSRKMLEELKKSTIESKGTSEKLEIESVIEKDGDIEDEKNGVEISLAELVDNATINGIRFDEYTEDIIMEIYDLELDPSVTFYNDPNALIYTSKGPSGIYTSEGLDGAIVEYDSLTVWDDGWWFSHEYMIGYRGRSMISLEYKDGEMSLDHVIACYDEDYKTVDDGLGSYFKQHNINSLEEFAKNYGIRYNGDEFESYEAMTEYGLCWIASGKTSIIISNEDMQISVACGIDGNGDVVDFLVSVRKRM